MALFAFAFSPLPRGNVSFGQRPLLAGASLPTRPEMPPTSCHCCCSGDTSLVGMPYSLILFVTRMSSMLTIGVLPAVRGTAHGASKPKRPFNPPEVAAYDSIEEDHSGSERLSAQPQDPALQHVKRQTDSVQGLRLRC